MTQNYFPREIGAHMARLGFREIFLKSLGVLVCDGSITDFVTFDHLSTRNVADTMKWPQPGRVVPACHKTWFNAIMK